METTIKKVHEEVIRQIRSYEDFPSKSKFDDGYLCAMNLILKVIETDGRFKCKEKTK